jgi:hypothetical protein
VSSEYVEVACDESGNEGENLTQAGSRVFVHAGVIIAKEDADELMSRLRFDLDSPAAEIKSKQLLRPANHDVLESFLSEPRLVGKVNIHLTDKRYFAIGKIVDLIVEPVLHEAGINIYRDGAAGDMARLLFVQAPAQLEAHWDTAVDQFNRMLRTTVRNGLPATLSDFYASVAALRPRATGMLSEVLRFIDAGRAEAVDLIANKAKTAEDYLALDPTFAALATVVRT